MYSCIAPAPLSLLQNTIYHTALYHTTSYCATSHQVVSNQPTNPVLTQPAPNCTTWTELWILQCAVCHWVQCSIIRAQWYRTSSGSGRNPPTSTSNQTTFTSIHPITTSIHSNTITITSTHLIHTSTYLRNTCTLQNATVLSFQRTKPSNSLASSDCT